MHSRLRGFQERVDRAKRIIREAEGKGRSVFSISWGKDSAAMLGLALEICDRITVLHISGPAALPGWEPMRDSYLREYAARIDYHELPSSIAPDGLEAYLRSQLNDPGGFLDDYKTAGGGWKANYDVEKDMAWAWAIENGYVVNYVGLRIGENPRTRGKLLWSKGELFRRKNGCWMCCPLGRWSAKDVWAYIFSRGLPYHPMYDNEAFGMTRETLRLTEWTFCPDPHRNAQIVWLQRFYPEQYLLMKRVAPHMETYR